jgi:hypothetical protein
MTTVITEGRRTAEFLISEAHGERSREQSTLLSGQSVKAGHVLGAVSKGAASAAAFAGNTGNGTIGAITVGAGAKVGAYKLVLIEPAANAGVFELEDPDGKIVKTGVVAGAFSSGGLGFTLADGATDFVAGDGFTITVAAGSGKYKEWNPANTDGSEVAVTIAYANVDASLADKRFVRIARHAEVNGKVLEYFSGVTDNDKAAAKIQLAAVGIIVR